MLEFEWDDDKARSNLAKHGVSFADAARAFDDMNGFDAGQEVIEGELRWLFLGMCGLELLAVAYTERDERIRVISARKANRREQRIYAKNRED